MSYCWADSSNDIMYVEKSSSIIYIYRLTCTLERTCMLLISFFIIHVCLLPYIMISNRKSCPRLNQLLKPIIFCSSLVAREGNTKCSSVNGTLIDMKIHVVTFVSSLRIGVDFFNNAVFISNLIISILKYLQSIYIINILIYILTAWGNKWRK